MLEHLAQFSEDLKNDEKILQSALKRIDEVFTEPRRGQGDFGDVGHAKGFS